MDSYSVSYNAADDQNSSYTSSPTLNVRILAVAGIIVVLVVLLVIAMHLYVRRIWADFGWVAGDRMADVQHPERMQDAPVGLDKGVLDTLPTFVYTKESMKEPMECSVCISEFRENETGRLLPKCKHCFHTACIDMWFLSHSTCPLCRATVGEESISHKDAENLRVDEEIGVQAAPSHVVSVELTFDPNYRTMAEEQISNDVLKNAFERQATYSEQQQQEHPHCNSHKNLEKDPSVQYPLNTLFYGNQNHGNLRSSSNAERFKKLEHLVIEVPSRPTIHPSNCASRPTSPTPTPTSGHEFGSPLSHLKTIKRIFSMREKRSSVPATPKSINHFHGQTILTP